MNLVSLAVTVIESTREASFLVKWASNTHPISDIRDWSKLDRLELQPDFQRKEVWSETARIMLMDTILREIPMPKIFVAATIVGGNTHRIVIDGQQRLSAILSFMRDEFALAPPYHGVLIGKRFSDFDEAQSEAFLSYEIDFNAAKNPSEKEVREVYARVNKYTVPLNKQELRRADYPGDFLDVSEELADHPYLDKAKIFSTTQRRRYADVEYTSELLAAMLKGIQDKKGDLDALYQEFSVWEKTGKATTISEFENTLQSIKVLFSNIPIEDTRFSQRSDFYSLFHAVLELLREGGTLEGKDLTPLQMDFRVLDMYIEPESDVRLLSEYAIKCVSQANTLGSRTWRHDFLRVFLQGTYLSKLPNAAGAEIFSSVWADLSIDHGFCPPTELPCAICDQPVDTNLVDVFLAWPRGASVFQLQNAEVVHMETCAASASGYHLIQIPKTKDVGQQTLL